MHNILLSAYACDPSRGSEYGNGWNWARQLALQGKNVHVITTSRGKDKIEAQLNLEPNLRNSLTFHFVDHSNFWNKAYYLNFILMYIAYFLWQNKILALARVLHSQNSFSVVHHVTWASIRIGTALNKLNDTRLIYGPVGGGHKASKKFKKYFFDEWKKESLRNKVGDLISFINPLTRSTLKSSHVVLVANSETQKYAIDNGAKVTQLFLDSAIDVNVGSDFIQSKDFSKEKLQLLWVGRMFAFKGLSIVIEALSKLDSKVKSKIHLDVVGDGPFMKKAKELIEIYKVSDLITFHGNVPFEKVKEFYTSADLFIFCSLRDSFGSQILEAASYGLPIITLNQNGVKSFLPDDCSIKASVSDPKITVSEISDAIQTLVLDNNLRKQKSIHAYRFACLNTWQNKVMNVTKSYYPS